MKSLPVTPKQFGHALAAERVSAGVSQDKMAERLGVGRRAIQDWEAGRTAPNFIKTVEWFHALGVNPWRPLLNLAYPELFAPLKINEEDKDDMVLTALIEYIQSASPVERRQLLFLISGAHGSSWIGLLQMMLAHVHTPLISRVPVCTTIWANYKMAQANNRLVCPTQAPPDLKKLEDALHAGSSAAIQGKDAYTIIDAPENYDSDILPF